MDSLRPYLGLAIYPAAFLLGFAVNPVEFSWSFRLARQRRPLDDSMPAEVRNKADEVNRYLNFLVDGLILLFSTILLRGTALGPARVGLQLANWERNAVIGIATGTLLVLTQSLVVRQVPVDPQHPFTYQVQRGCPALWVLIFITGAFSQELWIALCLVVFLATGHSAAVAIAATVVVFAAMHYSYRFWGALAVAITAAISALLFLQFRSLVVTFLYHFVGNIGSLYWNRYWRR